MPRHPLSHRLLAQFLVGAAILLSATPGWAGIVPFTANPATFLPGQDVTLSWSVTAGDVISINQGVGTVTGATGSVNVLPTALTTYTLTDTTSGTSAQVTVTPVAVAARLPPTACGSPAAGRAPRPTSTCQTAS